MNKLTTTPFDAAEYLDSEETMAAYLDACFEEGGIELFQDALNDVARAKGISAVAASTGITRPGLYKALGENGNPSLETIARILGAFNLRLSVQPVHHP